MSPGKNVRCDGGTAIRAGTDARRIADVQAHATSVPKLTLTPDRILSMAESD